MEDNYLLVAALAKLEQPKVEIMNKILYESKSQRDNVSWP
jgi:hypothetical protein